MVVQKSSKHALYGTGTYTRPDRPEGLRPAPAYLAGGLAAGLTLCRPTTLYNCTKRRCTCISVQVVGFLPVLVGNGTDFVSALPAL